jgi:uronate dehydrogenase
VVEKRSVVLTGAAGRIGALVTRQLGSRWRLLATDRPGSGAVELDVTDAAACRRVFDAADAVVHLAGVPDPDAEWDALWPANVLGAYSVATAAMAAGTRRLVLASSLQAVSAYPEQQQVRGEDPPRPANLYGATKAWGEALGSWVAATSTVEVVALRIGNFAAEAPPVAASARDRAAWLSHDDCAELVRAAVEGDVDHRFTVINGVSANRCRQAAYGLAERRLGFRPTDDAWQRP